MNVTSLFKGTFSYFETELLLGTRVVLIEFVQYSCPFESLIDSGNESNTLCSV